MAWIHFEGTWRAHASPRCIEGSREHSQRWSIWSVLEQYSRSTGHAHVKEREIHTAQYSPDIAPSGEITEKIAGKLQGTNAAICDNYLDGRRSEKRLLEVAGATAVPLGTTTPRTRGLHALIDRFSQNFRRYQMVAVTEKSIRILRSLTSSGTSE